MLKKLNVKKKLAFCHIFIIGDISIGGPLGPSPTLATSLVTVATDTKLPQLVFLHAGKEVNVVFYFSTFTRRFAVTMVAITAKAHGPRQVGLRCFGSCTAAS